MIIRKSLLFVAFTFFSAFCLVAGMGAHINEDIEIKVSENWKDNVISIGGNVKIKGEVAESVNVVGGSLVLSGTVKKDVVCILTDIELEDSAVIEGDFIAIGGEIRRSCKATIGGGIFTTRLLDFDKVDNSLIPMIFDSGNKIVKVSKIVFWVILALIFFAIFPQKVYDAVDIANKRPLRILVTGFISIVISLILFALFVLLSFLLIGIPFLLVLILMSFVFLLIGRTVVFYIGGEKLLGIFKVEYKSLNPVYLILTGALLYLSLKFIPIIGAPAVMLLNVIEFGAGVVYLLRKKMKIS